MKIGQQIKTVRLKLHMSQTEFSSLFGVSFATVNRWENDRTTPNTARNANSNSFAERKIFP